MKEKENKTEFTESKVDKVIEFLVKPRTLFIIPFIFFSVFVFISFIYFIIIGFYSDAFNLSLCLTPTCIAKFKNIFSPAYEIFYASFTFTAGLVAVLAAFTAVHTYQLSVKNNILANHIAHFDMFSDYLSGELEKLPRLDKKSIDGFRFFIFIFPNSRNGDFSPSDIYVKFIDRVVDLIILSGKNYSGEESEIFYSFKSHQERVRNLMLECGIDLALKPNKTDFFRMEKEVYDLLQRINECFCASQNLKKIPKPSYS